MKKLHITALFLVAGILSSSVSFSYSRYDLTDTLVERNDLAVTSTLLRPYMHDPKILRRLNNWLTHYKNNPYVVDCQYKLRPYFQSGKVLGPICYFLRQDNKKKRLSALWFVKRYLMEIKAALREITNDPRYADLQRQTGKNYRALAARYLKMFNGSELDTIKKCFKSAFNVNYPKDGSYHFSPFQFASSCFHSSFRKIKGKPYFALNIAQEFPNHPGHAISDTGWIPGNSAAYFTQNDYSEKLGNALASKHNLMASRYPLSGNGSVRAFMKKNPLSVFTEAEGFYNMDNHPVWSQKHGIFAELKRAFDSAEDSIFMDIFFLGGTMGAALAKHIVKLLHVKPNLKVFIIRDNYNHYGHEDVMRPVFNYLLAYSYNNPDRLVITSAYIKAHKSGLPSFMHPVVTDSFLKKSGLQKHLSLYGRAVSDHSKVIVIDAKTDNATAYVGSKNLTDESGATCYDEVVRVTGPAAKVVQDDYYFDMFYSLKLEMNKQYSNYIGHLSKNGWSSNLHRRSLSLEQMIANILKPFDLLNRDEKGTAHVSRREITAPVTGKIPVRVGMNNFDSTRTSAVDQVLQMIMFAKKSIYIKDQYLFDRNVVSALINARKKNRRLDIRVILEPLKMTNPPGLPNLLYLDLLVDAGIKIKWKKTDDNHYIHQEYHMKTISADGRYLISGSANKDQSTMYGSFREEQLDLLDPTAARTHDKVFLNRWNSSSETAAFRGFRFRVPGGLKGLNGKPLSSKQFIYLLRNFVSILFDSKTL